MSVKLVMLKSGEDIIADVKELKTEEGIVGYYSVSYTHLTLPTSG